MGVTGFETPTLNPPELEIAALPTSEVGRFMLVNPVNLI